jgi:hypothetical protein
MEFLGVHYARMESGFVFGNHKAGFIEDFAEASFGFPVGMTRKMWLYLKLKSS